MRVALETYRLQERSLKETAELLGISVAATKGRLFQAKAALRNSSRGKIILICERGARHEHPSGASLLPSPGIGHGPSSFKAFARSAG